jgi:hypothetical protein
LPCPLQISLAGRPRCEQSRLSLKSKETDTVARYIDASPRQRFMQYLRPAARKALKEGWAEFTRKDILSRVGKLGERPADELGQRRWDRRIAALREEFRANERRERMDRWLAGEIDCPPEVRAEYEKHGQRIPAWLRP